MTEFRRTDGRDVGGIFSDRMADVKFARNLPKL